MEAIFKKVKTYLDVLNKNRYYSIGKITDVTYYPCEYKEAGEMPDVTLFVPFDINKDTWGNGYDKHAWFRFFVDVPEDYENIFLYMNDYSQSNAGLDVAKNPQFIAYVDGKIVQGIDIHHRRLYFKSAGKHEVIFYAYTGMYPHWGKFNVELMRLNRDVEKLWYDIKIPFDSLDYLQTYSGEYTTILNSLNKAMMLLELYAVPSKEFWASVRKASEYMDNEFYGRLVDPSGDAPTVVGIGHTHIDCAWLWTLKQTREKVQRSFSTVVELMKRYPEYKFMSSQAFLYQNLKEEQPELYEEIKQLIKEGRWECEGAMWVEADCNLSSGESLVRQVMYGKRFFKQEFDVDNRVLWLPDVFGYSAALPQILKKSGVDWFLTSKITWNDTNMMPYDTFKWKGIDGTKINAYFLTAQNKTRGNAPRRFADYVGRTTPAMTAGAYDRYQQKELNNEVILTFGFGDGGGGPTEEHLEMARRLSKGLPGTPCLKIDFAGDTLSRIEERIKDNPRLPVWQGELYLEYHRGTYTSQCKNKKNNRRSEELYLNTELLCTLDKQLLANEFPKTELHKGWEMLLTNQFHDIIPGSSIHEVYEQCDIDYVKIKSIACEKLNGSLSHIATEISQDNGYVVFNPNPTEGKGVIKIDGKSVYVNNIPAKGYACVREFKSDNSISVSEKECENKFFKILFNDDMNIVSLYDKINEREIIAEGGVGNELRIYADYPDKYDAWEWSEYTLDKYISVGGVQSVECVNDGVRAGVRITRSFMSSTFVQTLWLYDDIDRIDVEFDADWQERHQGLKVAFDVDINSSKATYEIQYGTVERPTYKNTSWDKAKFEVCGHRFADLSEGNYGVSLLNDCKYGYDIHDSLMTLTLLRAPTFPDEEADRGKQSCVYSLYPHGGTFDAVKAYSHAYSLNNPMIAIKAFGNYNKLPLRYSPIFVDKQNILCEVIKEAEDSNDYIFRLFECSNTKTTAKIDFGFAVDGVVICDMCENDIKQLDVSNNSVCLDFGAFEIHTIKVKHGK